MLNVITPEEAISLIRNSFPLKCAEEIIPVEKSLGRVLYENVYAKEFVPGFDRSTVDGYALRGKDTFGCSESMPILLTMQGEITMGMTPNETLKNDMCMYVPTGGALPDGADAVEMIEYAENFGDGTIAVSKSVAPGENVIHKGEDVYPGLLVLEAGRIITPADIGALASMGYSEIGVCRKCTVGIISTGDELTEIYETPFPGQVRDSNSAMLYAAAEKYGADAHMLGIVRDKEELLSAAIDEAVRLYDMVILSGGSSVGKCDMASRLIEQKGKLLFHGLAMKPGKPTMLGIIDGKPVLGLPGHTVAAYYVANLLLPELIGRYLGNIYGIKCIKAVITEAVSANHGRAEYITVKLERKDNQLYATPIRTKSGLISRLAGTDGYICIARNTEGVSQGTAVNVYLDGNTGDF